MNEEGMSSMTSSSGWSALLGLGDSVPQVVLMPLAFIFFFFLILFPLYFLLGFTERKLTADLQARVGPNRTAGMGLLQVFADTLKLASKSTVPVESSLNPKWFAAENAVLYSSFVFLPFGTALIFLDSEMGAFLPLLCIAGVFLCSLFSGAGATDLENEIMTHRQSFLWISAWIPAVLATTVSVVRAGSAKWSSILSSQSGSVFDWVAFSSPFGFIAFFVFVFSGLVALQLRPFHTIDLGVRQRSGFRLGLFGLNGFYVTLVWCLLAAGLFLGGQAIRPSADVTVNVATYQFISALGKGAIIYLLLRVVARALPQLRQDQMTEFCWRVLTPVGVLCLLGELIWLEVFVGGTP
jgi:NADH-quinone oxidoreductase subunit H